MERVADCGRRAAGILSLLVVVLASLLVHGASVSALAEDNGLAPDTNLVVGQLLRIDNRHIAPASLDAGMLVINVPQRMLFYGADDDGLEGYPVAVGRSGWRTPSPPGTYPPRFSRSAGGRGAYSLPECRPARAIHSERSGSG